MRPSSKDLRIRVVHAYERHEGSMRQLAARFRLSLSCVRDLLTRYRLTGDVTPKPHGGGYPAKLDATGLAIVRTAIEHHPDATLQELCEGLRATAQITVSPATMSRGLAKLGLPRKKNVSRRRAGAPRHPAATRRLPQHPQTTGARRPRLSR
jgi:transposase